MKMCPKKVKESQITEKNVHSTRLPSARNTKIQKSVVLLHWIVFVVPILIHPIRLEENWYLVCLIFWKTSKQRMPLTKCDKMMIFCVLFNLLLNVPILQIEKLLIVSTPVRLHVVQEVSKKHFSVPSRTIFGQIMTVNDRDSCCS